MSLFGDKEINDSGLVDLGESSSESVDQLIVLPNLGGRRGVGEFIGLEEPNLVMERERRSPGFTLRRTV